MSAGLRQGRFSATASRYGFIRPTGGPPGDFFVPGRHTGGAFDGDLVSFSVIYEDLQADRREARVVEILERRHARLTGRVEGTRRHPFFVPDPPRLPSRLRIAGPLGSCLPGDRARAALRESAAGGLPAVELLERLGEGDDPALDAEVIASEYGLPSAYPEEALLEAERVRARLAGERWEGRRDLSGELAFTIDPADAQDHDDAVSIAQIPGGGWRLRVHIADVAEAVADGGAVDREARRRGNSVYLPGRMIPMLPELFARDLMSLRPGVPRPVVTLSMMIASDGALRGTRIEEARIVSRAALDYDRVQAFLEGQGGIGPQMDAALAQMHALARRLRARRLARGGFDLVVPEREVVLEAGGRPLELRRRLPQPSTQIIEEFMILANRVACGFAVRHGHPYLFRVHGEPDPQALERFRAQVRLFVPSVPPAAFRSLGGLRDWLHSLAPGPRAWQIHGLFLRAMQRALYAPEDSGHFGLGLRNYAHFTSPIRRYPDLFNHRVVKWALRRGRASVPAAWRDGCGETGWLSSETEERAQRAELAMIRLKSVRWAGERLGEEFAGRVVAVQPAGVYVEFDAVPVEGFLPREAYGGRAPAPRWRRRRAAEGDEVLLEPDLGVALVVQIARVDLRERQITLALPASRGKAPGRGKRAPAAEPKRGRGGQRGSGPGRRSRRRR